MIVHCGVTMFVQQFLHTAQCDGRQMTRVFQLQEALQVRRRLTSSHIHTFAVYSIQPEIKITQNLSATELLKWKLMCIWILKTFEMT